MTPAWKEQKSWLENQNVNPEGDHSGQTKLAFRSEHLNKWEESLQLTQALSEEHLSSVRVSTRNNSVPLQGLHLHKREWASSFFLDLQSWGKYRVYIFHTGKICHRQFLSTLRFPPNPHWTLTTSSLIFWCQQTSFLYFTYPVDISLLCLAKLNGFGEFNLSLSLRDSIFSKEFCSG